MKHTRKSPRSFKGLLAYLQAYPLVYITFPAGIFKSGEYRFSGFRGGELWWTHTNGKQISFSFACLECSQEGCPERFHEVGLIFAQDCFLLEVSGHTLRVEYRG